MRDGFGDACDEYDQLDRSAEVATTPHDTFDFFDERY
jgi:hypothetical protein